LPDNGLELAYVGVRSKHATKHSMLSSDSATLRSVLLAGPLPQNAGHLAVAIQPPRGLS
jgi:hypothetical protein